LNIIITESNDITSDLVMEWLISKKTKIRRLNNEVPNSISYAISNSGNIFVVENSIPEKIWHRRGKLSTTIPINREHSLNEYLKKESDSVIKSIELDLKHSIKYVGSFLKETENYKLTQLNFAKSSGLKIPNTLVTSSKKQLLEFINKYEKVVSKDIRYPVNFSVKDETFNSSGTILIDNQVLKNLNNIFNLILIQEYIEKEHELRIFFFEEKLYPMAIFSQSNEKTKIDFRNYDLELPNRCVPVKLPKIIEQKLLDFTKKMELNTGSIDMIYSIDKEYVFLEVNPQGQLDWLSKSCNYYIERDISDFFH